MERKDWLTCGLEERKMRRQAGMPEVLSDSVHDINSKQCKRNFALMLKSSVPLN